MAQVTAVTPAAKAVGCNRIVQARGRRLSVGRCRVAGQLKKGLAPENSPTSLGHPGYRGLDDALNEIQAEATLKVWDDAREAQQLLPHLSLGGYSWTLAARPNERLT